MTEFVFKKLIFITIKLDNWFIKLIKFFFIKFIKKLCKSLSHKTTNKFIHKYRLPQKKKWKQYHWVFFCCCLVWFKLLIFWYTFILQNWQKAAFSISSTGTFKDQEVLQDLQITHKTYCLHTFVLYIKCWNLQVIKYWSSTG